MRTLAGWCVRHRRIVVLLWVAVLVVSIFAVKSAGTDYSNNFSFPHTAVLRRHQPVEIRRALTLGGHRTGGVRHLR